MNEWPNGYKHALTPDEHERWNAAHFPGTRQLCIKCENPTGRCEEDSIYLERTVPDGASYGPLCRDCADVRMEPVSPAKEQ